MAIGSTLGLLGAQAVVPSALGPPSPLLADNIDPATRDFASLTRGSDPTDAQVQFSLQVIRGSGAAVHSVGMAAPPDKMLDSLSAELESDARIALAELVANGDVRIKNVLVDARPQDQFAVETVQYVNLRLMDGRVRSAVVSTPRATG